MKKLTLHCDYGYWHVPDGLKDNYSKKDYTNTDLRYNQDIIDYVLLHPLESDELRVFTIPDEATDYTILEYDGNENCIYIVDGKIHWLREYWRW